MVHTYAEKLEDLDKLRRSKYVQSHIGDAYWQTKQFLEKGRAVLFASTPCQIAGLRNYLGKEYVKLVTADLFCHGVPSPAVWQKFLAENTQKDKISAVDFRHKRFGWDASFLKITYKDGAGLPQAPKLLLPLLNAKEGFLFRRLCRLPFWISNLYERPSCHQCYFKGLDKMADFSMGDLWGVQRTYPNQYDKQGTSALLINTLKAQTLFSKLALDACPIDIKEVIKYNPYLITSVSSHPKRAEFFTRYRTEKLDILIQNLEKRNTTLRSFPLVIAKRLFRRLFFHSK